MFHLERFSSCVDENVPYPPPSNDNDGNKNIPSAVVTSRPLFTEYPKEKVKSASGALSVPDLSSPLEGEVDDLIEGNFIDDDFGLNSMEKEAKEIRLQQLKIEEEVRNLSRYKVIKRPSLALIFFP